MCRGFKVPFPMLLDTLARIGWTGPASAKAEPIVQTMEQVTKAADVEAA